MAELKGKIRNRIHNAFTKFRGDKNLRDLVKEIADVADCSVKSAGNAGIMYQQINVECNAIEGEV